MFTEKILVAHIDDAAAVQTVLATLQTLHGPSYAFAVGAWDGATQFCAERPDQTVYRFLISTEKAEIALQPGDTVRGPDADGPYVLQADAHASVKAKHTVALWPGDVVTTGGGHEPQVTLYGHGVYFEVRTAATPYPAPRLALLRNLGDFPGGCAAYPGAFRRETIPPHRSPANRGDQRGVNRVNEHTLDMRYDRQPPPIRHYHGRVEIGVGQFVNHSETAIVLPRAVYGLPEVSTPEQGEVLLYRRPAEDSSDQVIIPVRPGSIVVTPATATQVMGHCFLNAFAMLVAIPGFGAPYHLLG